VTGQPLDPATIWTMRHRDEHFSGGLNQGWQAGLDRRVLLAEVDRLTAALAAWHAECDKVGIPYDPPGLVRHHRGNAAAAAAGYQLAAENRRDAAVAELAAEREKTQRVVELAHRWIRSRDRDMRGRGTAILNVLNGDQS
jgi:hypothetical protein